MKKKIKTSNDDDNTEYKWTVSQLLQNAVKEHNIEDIRGSLWSCIAVDPTLSKKFLWIMFYQMVFPKMNYMKLMMGKHLT